MDVTNKTLRNAPKMAVLMLRGNPQLVAARNFMKAQLGDAFEWTTDGDFHVTMVYLTGEESHPTLPKIDGSPLELKVSQAALWDSEDGKAVVLELEPTPELKAVQSALYTHYADHEKSEYSTPDDWKPHITLGYVADGEGVPQLGEFGVMGKRLELVQGEKTLSVKMLRDKASSKAAIDPDGNISYYMEARLSQPEAGYDPLGGDDFEACASCRWFQGDRCQVVNGHISPTGYSDLYMPIVQDMPMMDMGFMAKLKAFFAKDIITGPSGFKVLPDGKRWLAWYTNAYEDKEAEGFPTQALQNSVNRMWDAKKFPELWFYHIPGTKHGQADWVGLVGRFVLATGEFDDSPLAKSLIATYKDERVSHGFRYNADMKVKGWYWDFDTFEISPVPKGREANPYTYFEVMSMLDENQVAELEKRLPPDLAKQLIQQATEATDKADKSGVAFKAEDQPAPAAEKQDASPLDARVTAIEGAVIQIGENLKAITAVLTAKVADMEDDDDEEDEEKSRSQGASILTDEMKTALLADYEALQGKAAKQRRLADLDPAARALVEIGLVKAE